MVSVQGMMLQQVLVIALWSVSTLSFQPTTVTNPETKRVIKVQGPTFVALLQTGYVYHDGRLFPIRPGHYQEPILCKEWTEVEPEYSTKQTCDDDSDRTLTTGNTAGILFVNKASGLLTVPGREQPDCLIQRVLEKYPQAKVCHRLDRDTSGVVVMALNAPIHRHVSKQFESRQTSKIYTALIAGHPKQDKGTIDLPIGKATTEEGYNRWVIGGAKPRAATTEWKVEERLQRDGLRYTRVRVQPLTGRGQQIRLHMQAMGHALLGDTLHAPPDIAKAAPRLCLHATQLGFLLDDGSYVHATAPPPF